MRDHYYKKGHGFLVVFSVLQKSSFMSVERIIASIYRLKNAQDVPIVVAGNKIDLADQREVSNEEARDFAERVGLKYIETSARTGQNIEEAFCSLVQLIDARQNRIHKQEAGSQKSSGSSSSSAPQSSDAGQADDEEVIRRRRKKQCTLL